MLIRFSLLFFCSSVLAQSPEKILNDHFSKYGQEMWSGVQTIVIDGKWTTENFEKYPIKITLKRPDKIKLEGTWGGNKFAECWNGLVGWTVAPWNGTMELKAMDRESTDITRYIFTFGSPLFPVVDQLQFLGLENYEGELLLHFQSTNETTTSDFYLGKQDHMLYWEKYTTGAENPTVITKQYEKYKNYHGLLAPTSVTISSTSKGGRELVFETISLGVGASDAIFEIPRK